MSIFNENTEHLDPPESAVYISQTAEALQNAVRSTLGPMGMDKLLVQEDEITITNHGSIILEEVEINNPVGEILLSVADHQRKKYGDGTTTAILYATEFILQAVELINDGIHPINIVQGYNKALNKCISNLDSIEVAAEEGDVQTIIKTSLAGKFAEGTSQELVSLLNTATRLLNEEGLRFDDYIGVETLGNRSVTDSEIIHGIILKRSHLKGWEPIAFDEASFLVLGSKATLDITPDHLPVDLSVENTNQKHIHTYESRRREQKLAKIRELNPDVVVVHRGVDDVIGDYLEKNNILAVRGFGSPTPVSRISRTVGANVITHLSEATAADLGSGSVSKLSKTDRFYISGSNSLDMTIIASGWTEKQAAEIRRSVQHAIDMAQHVSIGDNLLPGGGATEIELSSHIRKKARGEGGREQLAINSFAESLGIIPQTLADNAGHNVVDTKTCLNKMHADGYTRSGVGNKEMVFEDATKCGVLESREVKEQALVRAAKIANYIIRIDHIIGSDGLSTKSPEDELDRAPRPWEMV